MMLKSMRDHDLQSLVEMPGGRIRGPMFHLEAIDWKVPGIAPGKLVVIGGYVGSYKTLLGINLMHKNAIELRYNVLFLSLEMYEREIYQRLAVCHANSPRFEKYSIKIQMSKLRDGTLSQDEKDFLNDVVIRDLKTNPDYGHIAVADDLTFKGDLKGLMEEAEKVWQVKTPGSKGNLDLVIIDYVQLLARYWTDGRNIMEAVSNTARYLKKLAMTFGGRGAVVVALSQLSRASYMAAKESVKQSRESDPYQYLYNVTSFAESSEIERASDMCLTLFSDDKLKEEHQVLAQLVKNRDGETLDKGFRLRADPDHGYIGDFVDQSADDYVGELLAEVFRL